MSNRKVAVIWIDDHGRNSTQRAVYGHLCTEDEPDHVERVSLERLSAKYIYITNVRPNRFAALGLKAHLGIRNTQFFGFTLANIAIELNLSDELSKKLPVLTRVCALAARSYSDILNIDFDSQHARFTVLEELREKIYPELGYSKITLEGTHNEKFLLGINNACQKLQANDLRTASDKVVCARFAKTPYFFHLLTQNYPIDNDYSESGDWNNIQVGTDRDGQKHNSEKIQQLIEFAKHNAGFVKFEVTSMCHLHERYFPLGREISSTKNREWATFPEVIDLLNYALVKIKGVYFTKAGKLPIAPTPPEPTEVHYHSYTNGLVNQSMWMALSYKMQTERFYHPIATYIRAYDRVMCRMVAFDLVKQGYQCVGFSNGAVRFAVSSTGTYESMVDEMLKVGLMPQLGER